MERGTIFLPFWPPMTLLIEYWVVEEVKLLRWPQLFYSCLDLQVLHGSLQSPSLPLCRLSCWHSRIGTYGADAWNPPHTHTFKKTWRIWNGERRPMCKSQLLFYLLRVYFLRERCSLSKAWDHPGQWNSLETDGLVRWVSLGTSCLTSQEIGWEFQSHCTTVPGDSNFSTHKAPEGERVDLQQSPSCLPFQGPCFSAWIPSYWFLDPPIPQPPASPCNSAQTYLKVSLRSWESQSFPSLCGYHIHYS